MEDIELDIIVTVTGTTIYWGAKIGSWITPWIRAKTKQAA